MWLDQIGVVGQHRRDIEGLSKSVAHQMRTGIHIGAFSSVFHK